MIRSALVPHVSTKTRRGQIEILVEILTLASPSSSPNGVTKTHLAYSSGLNFRRFGRYLELLTQKRLLEYADDAETGMAIYRTTIEGEAVRQILIRAEKMIFGEKVDEEAMPEHPLEVAW